MNTIELFKRAGVSPELLKSIAMGAGVGAAGLGGSAALTGEEGESPDEKRKRVLMDSALGAGLGGSISGGLGAASQLTSRSPYYPNEVEQILDKYKGMNLDPRKFNVSHPVLNALSITGQYGSSPISPEDLAISGGIAGLRTIGDYAKAKANYIEPLQSWERQVKPNDLLASTPGPINRKDVETLFRSTNPTHLRALEPESNREGPAVKPDKPARKGALKHLAFGSSGNAKLLGLMDLLSERERKTRPRTIDAGPLEDIPEKQTNTLYGRSDPFDDPLKPKKQSRAPVERPPLYHSTIWDKEVANDPAAANKSKLQKFFDRLAGKTNYKSRTGPNTGTSRLSSWDPSHIADIPEFKGHIVGPYNKFLARHIAKAMGNPKTERLARGIVGGGVFTKNMAGTMLARYLLNKGTEGFTRARYGSPQTELWNAWNKK